MPSEHLRLADNLFLSSTDETAAQAWEPPANITDRTITEARALLPALVEQHAVARQGVRLKWLAELGILVAGAMNLGDAKAKLAAYASALQYPEFCFTNETKIDAARQFKFFPAFAELSEFFDAICRPRRERVRRVRALASIELAAVAERRQADEARRREVAEYEAEQRKRWDEAAAARDAHFQAAGSMRPLADATVKEP